MVAVPNVESVAKHGEDVAVLMDRAGCPDIAEKVRESAELLREVVRDFERLEKEG